MWSMFNSYKDYRGVCGGYSFYIFYKRNPIPKTAARWALAPGPARRRSPLSAGAGSPGSTLRETRQ